MPSNAERWRLKYPNAIPVSQNTKAAIRAVEILAIALSFMFKTGTGMLVSFVLMAINELTAFAPVRAVRSFFSMALEGTVEPQGELVTQLNRNLGGSVTPAGQLDAAKVPRTLEYKGYVATIAVDRPGNGFKGRVTNSDAPIHFTADLVDQLELKFHNAVDFYLELYSDRALRPHNG